VTADKTYEDILNVEYPVKTGRARMSMHDRAAQFSPFSALVGYDSMMIKLLSLQKIQDMKIKKGFVLRPTLGYTVAVATGELAKSFGGMIKLNETSADIWRWIDDGLSREEVINRYVDAYNVSVEIAARDYDAMVEQMNEAGVFEQ